MDSKKYIGMDVHKESISIAVMNGAGKIVMECVIETKARKERPQWIAKSISVWMYTRKAFRLRS
jgi:hypothetical protein